MPIKPENKARYPKNWKQIRAEILERAKHCCEGSPKFPDCRARNYNWHPVTGSNVVLTIAHLDHVPENCHHDNLKAMCQRCHLNYDIDHHKINSAASRKAKANTVDMFTDKQESGNE